METALSTALGVLTRVTSGLFASAREIVDSDVVISIIYNCNL